MILGLLLDAPAHGYELRRCLAPFFGAAGPLNAGLFYPVLATLERRRWVSKENVPQERAPARHVYAITRAGSREFMSWLETAGDQPPRYDFFHRDPVLVRVMFFRHLPAERIRALLGEEVARADARCQDYGETRTGMVARKADPYRIRILEFGRRYHRLRRAWILELLAEVDGAPSGHGRSRRRARPGGRSAPSKQGERVHFTTTNRRRR
jgi:DNA-binding PadR family transcriptional regulator